MLPLVLAHRRIVLLSLSAALVTQLLLVSAPRVVMAGIDSALVEQSRPIELFAGILVAIALARLATNSLHRRLLFATSAHLEHDLRALAQASLSRQGFAWYDRHSTGALVSRANSDIRAIERFLTFMPAVLITFIGFALALALMLSIHVGLALAAMAPLPFVYLSGTRMRRVLWPIAWLVQSRTADVATVVEENLAGAHVVRGMSAEPAQIGRLERSAERLRWIATEEIAVRAKHEPLIENVPRLGVAAVLLYGGLLAIDGSITIGALVAFAGYVALMQQPFRLLGFIVVMGQRASASSARVLELLDAEPELAERSDPVRLDDPVGDVVFDDVRFGYGDGPDVLSGFDLRVRPGETVAVVGRTGSGKSTAARLIPRFYDVRAGRVTIDGHDVRDLGLQQLRTVVGVVTDEPFLFSASVRDNIAYGRPDASPDEVEKAARVADAAEFIERLPDGYDTVVGERGYTLSGGQRQRIAIARTLLVNPRVLVLDDATSAIDVEVERRIHAALEQLLAGRTTLLVAHRLSTIALADRVVLLDGGRIVASGRHEELLRTVPLYAEVLAHTVEDAA
ncbi:MAG: ABC transporter ATP-binding protein [Frankiales bacterium]|nr:MAG: ABC transporter ATP-binding protein [Frankiales bacterium]